MFNDKGHLEIESFYSNGELQFEKEFFDTGIISKYSTFSYYNIKEDDRHNSRHSKSIVSVFYDAGELEELYHEDKEEFQGEYKKYWKKGFLQYEAIYDNGDENGIVREFYDNGLGNPKHIKKERNTDNHSCIQETVRLLRKRLGTMEY